MREECGVVAVCRKEQPAAGLVHRGLFALQHRGQEGAGIATWDADGMHFLKGRGLVAESLPTYKVERLTGNMGIGHVRYSTVPSDRTENIQPFVATLPFGHMAIGHNGNLKNQAALQRDLESRGSLISTSMDTELMVHLMARSGADSLETALHFMASRVQGAYSLVILLEGRLFALRDPCGIRPLVLGQTGDGFVAASETCALDALDAKYIGEVTPGELVEITPNGFRRTLLLEPGPLAPCVFELVYFARPNSVVFGQAVQSARVRMGQQLAIGDAEEGLSARPDIVVPVPDSGVPAAIGYSRESGIPLEMAILRSHYVGRTFILPDQDSRTHSIRLKLSVVREMVEGKRVLLVDDSIVRGNTSRKIVQMVREAGAREVWLRVASPALGWPCYLGIDTPSYGELIINRHTSVAEVERSLCADNLRYLSVDALKQATSNASFCFGCMTGDYPV
ncbi:MAG: amidophosphoribosyltransferase [Deltaproteobacteria bacterium RIFOXYA12_FULL_58_15]|nr:MAG: amidophosphoribosyltransferase [Deltaproteobacteria bacterium RIFOXYA12_FULL_58_15]